MTMRNLPVQFLTSFAMAALLAGCAAAPSVSERPIGGSAFAQAAKTPASSRHRETLYGNYLASLHASAQNDTASAAGYMDRVLADDPKNPNVLNEVFLYKLGDGDINGATQLAKKIVLVEPDNQLAAVTLAADAFSRSDYENAKLLIAKSDRRGLGALLIPLLSAWAESGLGNTDAALAALAPLSSQKPFLTFQAYHTALIAALGKRDDIAEENFTKTMTMPGGGSLRVTQAYGQFLESRGKHKQAAELYMLTLDRAPQHPVMIAALARAKAGNTSDMLITSATQGVVETLYGIGSVLSQDERAGPLPLIYLRLALDMQPDNPVAQTLLAGLLESLNQWDDASAVYQDIAKDSPLYPAAQIQAALNEENAGRTDNAIAGLRQLHAATPTNQTATMALADLLRSNEQYAEAAKAYDTAIAQITSEQPQHWSLYYARGVCFERLGKWSESERDLHKALELAPEHPLVLNYLGYSWIDRGENLVKAREMIESAARQRPRDGFIIDSLGWALYRGGDYAGAVVALENAITLRPQDPVINDHLGDAYWRVGRKLEARFQWRRALTFKPEPALVRIIENKLEAGPDHKVPDPKLADRSAAKS